MSQNIKRFVESSEFRRIVLGSILLTAILVGVETIPQFNSTTSAGKIVLAVQNVILGIFVVEAVLKMAAHGRRPWRYFYNPWNVFDFVIVGICVLPLDTKFIAIFRMARVLRTLRLISVLPQLQLLVTALLRSIPSLGYVGLLLGLHFYVYAVAGTFLFRQNDPLHFGTLWETSLTLFQVLTMEGWPEYLRIQMHGSDLYYSEHQMQLAGQGRISSGAPIIAPLYFASFIVFGTMIVMNLFTGVIVQGLEEAENEVAKGNREEHQRKLGHITVGDEVTVLRERLEQISQRMHLLLSERATELEMGFEPSEAASPACDLELADEPEVENSPV